MSGIILAGAGCKKSSSGSSVTCSCNYRYIPGRDTTGTFNVQAPSGVNQATICDSEAVALTATYGAATCTVY